jgi:hypothetical protein
VLTWKGLVEKKINAEADEVARTLQGTVKDGMDDALGNDHQRIPLYGKLKISHRMVTTGLLIQNDIIQGLTIRWDIPMQLPYDIFQTQDLITELVLQFFIHVDDPVSGKALVYIPVFIQDLVVAHPLIYQMVRIQASA